VKAYRIERRRGYHIFQAIASQMEVKLSDSEPWAPASLYPPERFMVLISGIKCYLILRKGILTEKLMVAELLKNFPRK
jgi:hypothetical protein